MANSDGRFHILMRQPDGNGLLMFVDSGQASLPTIRVPQGSDILDAQLVNGEVHKQWGVDVRMLHSMHCYRRPESPLLVCTIENCGHDWEPDENYRWLDCEALSAWRVSDFEAAIIETWFCEQATQRVLLPWWQPGWAAQALEWITDALSDNKRVPLGRPEQLKSWYLSTVWRVPTTKGDRYFKASPPYAAQEVALAARWRDSKPDGVPGAIAIDVERSWVLTEDMQGRSLEQSRDIGEWGAALRDYARFQQGAGAVANRYLADGYEDRRLERLPDLAAHLFASHAKLLSGLPTNHVDYDATRLRVLLPAIGELCGSSGDPADALAHGDFHGMNVFRSGGRSLFFDWAAAHVSHPFFDVIELLSADDWMPSVPGAYEALRDQYLAEWTAYESMDCLRVLYEGLRPLWFLTSALGSESLLVAMETSVPLSDRLVHSCAHWATQQLQYGVAVTLGY